MNLLNNTKVYLAGPIEYASSPISWRQELTLFLNKIGVRVYDPLVKPIWFHYAAKANPKIYIDAILGKSPELSSEEAFTGLDYVRKLDLRYVNDCEWMIVHLPREFSAGTGEELAVAAQTGKPVLVFSQCEIPASWSLVQLAKSNDWRNVFFPSLEALKTHITNIDNGNVKLDVAKWIFLSYFRNDVKWE